jgi:O-antigen ligase
MDTGKKHLFSGIFFILLFLVYTPNFPDPSIAIKWLVIALGALTFLVLHRKEVFGFSLGWLPILIWGIYGLVLASGAVNTGESLSVGAKYFTVILAAVVFSVLWKNENFQAQTTAKWLGWGLLVVWLSALVGIMQNAASFSENLYKIQGVGGHKNQLSMLLLVAALVYAYNARHQHKLKALYVFLSSSSVLMVVLLRTRSLWIALAVIAVFIGIHLYLRNKSTRNVKVFLPAALVGLIIGGLVLSNFNDAGDATNLSHRVAFWQKSKAMIADHPEGVGPGMWKLHFPAYGLQGVNHSVEQGQTQILRPHNDYLWILAETGWIGAILWLGFIGLVVYGLVIRGKKAENEEGKDFVLLVSTVLLAYAIFMLFDFPMERPEQLFMLLWFSGFSLSALHKQAQHKMLTPFVGALLIAGGWIGFQRFSGDANLNDVITYHSKKKTKELIRAVDQCENSFYTLDRVANPLAYYRGLAFLAERNVLESYLDFERGLAMAPHNIITLNQMGNLHKLAGRNLSPEDIARLRQQIPQLAQDLIEESTVYYRRALDISPHFTEALLNMAEHTLLSGDPHGALGYLSQVYPPDYRSPKFQKLAEQSLKQWAVLPANERRRPALVAWFQQHDPRMERAVETYIQFLIKS